MLSEGIADARRNVDADVLGDKWRKRKKGDRRSKAVQITTATAGHFRDAALAALKLGDAETRRRGLASYTYCGMISAESLCGPGADPLKPSEMLWR